MSDEHVVSADTHPDSSVAGEDRAERGEGADEMHGPERPAEADETQSSPELGGPVVDEGALLRALAHEDDSSQDAQDDSSQNDSSPGSAAEGGVHTGVEAEPETPDAETPDAYAADETPDAEVLDGARGASREALGRADVEFSLLDIYALPELLGDRGVVEEILAGPDSHELGAAPLHTEASSSREVALYSDLEAEAVLHNLPEAVVLERLGSSLRGHLPLGAQGPAPELELPEPTPPAPTRAQRREARRRRRRGEDITRPPKVLRPAPQPAAAASAPLVPSAGVLIELAEARGGRADEGQLTSGDLAEVEARVRRVRRGHRRRKQAVVAGGLLVLGLAVSAPVLYLRGGEEPVDPARRALEVYAASLGGDTRFDAEAERIEPQLIRRPLGDGRVEVVSLVPGGSCWVLTVEPDGSQEIERGSEMQCRRQEGDEGGA